MFQLPPPVITAPVQGFATGGEELPPVCNDMREKSQTMCLGAATAFCCCHYCSVGPWLFYLGWRMSQCDENDDLETKKKRIKHVRVASKGTYWCAGLCMIPLAMFTGLIGLWNAVHTSGENTLWFSDQFDWTTIGDHQYKAFPFFHGTYSEAQKFCETQGGHLPKIADKTTHDALVSHINEFNHKNATCKYEYWVGLSSHLNADKQKQYKWDMDGVFLQNSDWNGFKDSAKAFDLLGTTTTTTTAAGGASSTSTTTTTTAASRQLSTDGPFHCVRISHTEYRNELGCKNKKDTPNANSTMHWHAFDCRNPETNKDVVMSAVCERPTKSNNATAPIYAGLGISGQKIPVTEDEDTYNRRMAGVPVYVTTKVNEVMTVRVTNSWTDKSTVIKGVTGEEENEDMCLTWNNAKKRRSRGKDFAGSKLLVNDCYGLNYAYNFEYNEDKKSFYPEDAYVNLFGTNVAPYDFEREGNYYDAVLVNEKESAVQVTGESTGPKEYFPRIFPFQKVKMESYWNTMGLIYIVWAIASIVWAILIIVWNVKRHKKIDKYVEMLVAAQRSMQYPGQMIGLYTPQPSGMVPMYGAQPTGMYGPQPTGQPMYGSQTTGGDPAAGNISGGTPMAVK